MVMISVTTAVPGEPLTQKPTDLPGEVILDIIDEQHTLRPEGEILKRWEAPKEISSGPKEIL